MSVELLLQAVQTLAVVAGIMFGLAQLRQLREQREIQASVQLLQPLQRAETARAILILHGLPEDLTGDELRETLGADFGDVLGVLAVFESLGPLVARGHLPIEMYSEFYRGATVLGWSKVRRYVEEQRRAGWPNLFEWVQWLSERMIERQSSSRDKPAFERFETWKKASDYARLCS